ncbi:syntaxin-17 [Toxorhynchites rutilus septentrionalis]|uniref:syntaxin-17 n=1 Tax=Toxorhynchites rutilus septentrionalis TaxID=329112 RepID=UPI002478C401|nr:syntaxin-17 [Toxorhynchites rutilus septentrionalis]XP_055629027.1 syntaxin-17 [Toxorhynchites rutilus septentrionalis]
MDGDKISLKLAVISIQKFNQTIPQYLSLLKNHKCNIEKAGSLKDWDRIKREQINATRVIKQMKYLILEIDKVRSKVRDSDLEQFDDEISEAKRLAFTGMGEYLEMQEKFASRSQSSYSFQDDDCGQLEEGQQDNQYGSYLAQVPKITSSYDREEDEIRHRAECLKEMQNLQREIIDIQELYQTVHTLAHGQAQMVDAVEENVEVTQIHVEAGETALRKALRYQKAIYPMCGALLGSCIAGPIGLVVGLKAGGLAAIGGGLAGFAGGRYIKNEEGSDAVDAIDAGDKGEEIGANGVIIAESKQPICERSE